MKLVEALNAINSPLLAIVVIILGCIYSVVAHRYGLNNDSAAGIIGAGIGLLTGQVLSGTRQQAAPAVNIPPPSETLPAVSPVAGSAVMAKPGMPTK